MSASNTEKDDPEFYCDGSRPCPTESFFSCEQFPRVRSQSSFQFSFSRNQFPFSIHTIHYYLAIHVKVGYRDTVPIMPSAHELAELPCELSTTFSIYL